MDAAGAVITDSATPADAAAIGALHARSFLATYPTVPPISERTELAVWGRRVRAVGDDAVIVVCADAHVAGFAYIGPSDDADARPRTGHVHSLHVDPEFHRRGIGRRLLDEALRRFASAG